MLVAPPHCASVLRVGGWQGLQRYFHKHRIKKRAKGHSRPDKLKKKSQEDEHDQGAVVLTQSKRLVAGEFLIT